MKKILSILLSRYLYGKERSNIEVYNLLLDSGEYDVRVVTSDDADERLYLLLSQFSLYRLPIIDRHDKTHSRLSYFYSLIDSNIKLCKIISEYKPDILFLNSELSIYDLYFALMFFRGKIVYRIGDAPAYPNLRFKMYNTYIWQHFVVNRVDAMIFISEYIKNAVKLTGRDKKNDLVIYNYPPNRIVTHKEKIVKKKNVVTFGYIGQVIEIKGVAHFVEAAKKLLVHQENMHFIIAGSLSYDSVFAQEIVEMCGDDEHFTLLGEINDVESFFGAIDVLCVPSIKQEPLGNVIVEAKKYSKPCIIYPSGGMPELISHLHDGYICSSQNVDSLLEGMLYYVSNVNNIIGNSIEAKLSVNKLGIDRKSFEKKWFSVFEYL